MGCCCSAARRERQRDAELGWHNNDDDENDPREMSSESQRPVESKMELEGAAAPATLPAELESPVQTHPQQQRTEGDEPPPYSPAAGVSQLPVVMNREPRISDESSRSIRPGRASEDSGFEKREGTGIAIDDPGFDTNKYRGVVL